MFLGPNNSAGVKKGQSTQGWQHLRYGRSLAEYRSWATEQGRSAELEEFEAHLRRLFHELEVLPLSSNMLWRTKKPDASRTTACGTGVRVVRNDGDPPKKRTKKGESPEVAAATGGERLEPGEHETTILRPRSSTKREAAAATTSESKQQNKRHKAATEVELEPDDPSSTVVVDECPPEDPSSFVRYVSTT